VGFHLSGENGDAAKMQLPAYVRDPDNIADTYAMFEPDREGVLSAADIFLSDRFAQLPAVQNVLDEAARIMRLGADENLFAMTISPEDFKGLDAGFLWNYGNLSILVEEYASNHGVAQSLSSILDNAVKHARRGDDRGHDRMLKQFQEKVKKAVGKGLDAEEAEILINLSDSLF
jgi:hypothetical protein